MKMKNKKKAFSLTELSIIIMVVSVIIVMSLPTRTSNIAIKKSLETSDKVNQIYESLKVYVAKNKRLPCPAGLKIEDKDTAYGMEGECAASASLGVYTAGSAVYGMVPVKALGLPVGVAEDNYGNKFSYVVDASFTVAASPSPFLDPNEGSIIIKAYKLLLETEEAHAVFALISHGKNQKTEPYHAGGGAGAVLSGADQVTTDVDEMSNTAEGFKESILIASSVRNGAAFDDIVFYKNKKNLLLDANLQRLSTINNTGIAKAPPVN